MPHIRGVFCLWDKKVKLNKFIFHFKIVIIIMVISKSFLKRSILIIIITQLTFLYADSLTVLNSVPPNLDVHPTLDFDLRDNFSYNTTVIPSARINTLSRNGNVLVFTDDATENDVEAILSAAGYNVN